MIYKGQLPFCLFEQIYVPMRILWILFSPPISHSCSLNHHPISLPLNRRSSVLTFPNINYVLFSLSVYFRKHNVLRYLLSIYVSSVNFIFKLLSTLHSINRMLMIFLMFSANTFVAMLLVTFSLFLQICFQLGCWLLLCIHYS